VYNRVKLGSIHYLKQLGYTEGWGHFHVPEEIFDDVRTYLRRRRHAYAKGFKFGDGPNWRLRALRLAMSLIGLRPELLRHGVKREVFISELASNACDVLKGKRKHPKYDDLLLVEEIARLAKERWIVPRAERCPDYRFHTVDQMENLLFTEYVNRAGQDEDASYNINISVA
jgi:hypothetical protein